MEHTPITSRSLSQNRVNGECVAAHITWTSARGKREREKHIARWQLDAVPVDKPSSDREYRAIIQTTNLDRTLILLVSSRRGGGVATFLLRELLRMRMSPSTQVDVPGEKERSCFSIYVWPISHRAFSSFFLPLWCTRADYIRGHVIHESSFSTNFDEFVIFLCFNHLRDLYTQRYIFINSLPPPVVSPGFDISVIRRRAVQLEGDVRVGVSLPASQPRTTIIYLCRYVPIVYLHAVVSRPALTAHVASTAARVNAIRRLFPASCRRLFRCAFFAPWLAMHLRCRASSSHVEEDALLPSSASSPPSSAATGVFDRATTTCVATKVDEYRYATTTGPSIRPARTYAIAIGIDGCCWAHARLRESFRRPGIIRTILCSLRIAWNCSGCADTWYDKARYGVRVGIVIGVGCPKQNNARGYTVICRAERLWYKSSCAEDKQRVAIDRQSPPTHPEDARCISRLGKRNVATTAAMVLYTLERFSRSIREQVRQDEDTREPSRTFVDKEHGRFYLRIIMGIVGIHCWRT